MVDCTQAMLEAVAEDGRRMKAKQKELRLRPEQPPYRHIAMATTTWVGGQPEHLQAAKQARELGKPKMEQP